MKRSIALIRHAKSDWGHPELSDFDRPLNHRGEKDAPRMGKELKARGIGFDLVIASPANRALTTARAICNEIGYADERIEQNRELYMASAGDMLDIVHDADSSIQRLALVAHNPGITSLANALGDLTIDNMPTCSVVMFETDSEWRFLKPRGCTYLDFLYPRLLR